MIIIISVTLALKRGFGYSNNRGDEHENKSEERKNHQSGEEDVRH